MRPVRVSFVAIAALLAVAACAADAEAKPEQAFTPVIQSVNSPPRWYEADDGRFHVAYEDILTNAFPVQATLRSLEVRTRGGRTVATLSGDELTAAVSPLEGRTSRSSSSTPRRSRWPGSTSASPSGVTSRRG
jgi:hypothetical protein